MTCAVSSDDDYLEHLGHAFEPDMVNLFETLLKRDDIAFDVGANIGCTSLLFANLANKVFSFEPQPTTFQFLRDNVARSRFRNIDLHNCALGSQPAEAEITCAPSNRSGAFVSNKIKAGAGHLSERVVIKRLDDVFTNPNVPRVDFIKIDVEGFEKEVIAGARGVIREYQPIVVLELNHWCLNAFQRITVPDFFEYLMDTFPILLAVEGKSWLNIHDESDRYIVM